MLNEISLISSGLWIMYKRRFAHSVIINGSYTSYHLSPRIKSTNMMGGLGSYDLPDIRKIVNKEVAKQVLNGLEVLAEMGIMHNGRKFFLNVAYFRPTSSELPSDL